MRFVLFLTVMFAVGAAWAISDDANPWLAIESATCAAHRGTDYAAQLDMDVAIEVAEWRGATLTHDMHCFIGGTLEGTAFEIGLLTEHPGTAYATACADSHLRLIRVLTPSGQPPDCRPW
jgi:hypothetical protein